MFEQQEEQDEEPQALRYVLPDSSESPMLADEHAVPPEIRARVRKLMRQHRDELSPGEGIETIESLPDDDA